MVSVAIEKKSKIDALTDKEKAKRIIKWIRYSDSKFRKRFAFLKYQNAIGFGITIGSAAGMIFLAGLYIAGLIPFWACIIGNGILASFLHEMEHDLIHSIYFKESPRMQNFLFWLVWLFRANTVNPWFRKEIHLLHHKLSGNPEDVEERFISNGMPFGWKRFLVMVDPIMAVVLQGPKIRKDAIHYLKKIKSSPIKGPFRSIFLLLWYSFLIWGSFAVLNWVIGSPIQEKGWVATAHNVLNTAAVVYLIPCWLRQTAIQIVSSNMHYYGDVKGLYQQTQVLDSWLVLPLHLFCFNFGATHGIHHFVVSQPFYLRQAVAPSVRPILKKYGIRFNDFESMLRANRYEKSTAGELELA
ncbi:stearoyl-CoA 9-desaturase [Leptospira fainei serovar Hurstbridge str. BUT 6]|uniref:Stearoyl-CoA 9-desaturase n=1 Tax=Leptospira fainei serovar Hurstbridge str. BUT 6 TaxID=1193011 RepID=S3UYT8_9LEPT|nr:fatty acid desaturase [Leptospira fainei]EPG74398.1 stearoyl-CoA 9-desaturase [Leptospira fainei serovar Hurstbridge str. BUT 6]